MFDKINRCMPGDTILHDGVKMWVSQVLIQGKERCKKDTGERADICACKIMDNGQILKRSPVNIGNEWQHIRGDS